MVEQPFPKTPVGKSFGSFGSVPKSTSSLSGALSESESVSNGLVSYIWILHHPTNHLRRYLDVVDLYQIVNSSPSEAPSPSVSGSNGSVPRVFFLHHRFHLHQIQDLCDCPNHPHLYLVLLLQDLKSHHYQVFIPQIRYSSSSELTFPSSKSEIPSLSESVSKELMSPS